MLAIPLGVFVIVSGLAFAVGAANLGVAVMLRAAPPPRDRG